MASVSSFGVRSPRPRFYQELDHCVYRFNVSHHKQKTPIHPILLQSNRYCKQPKFHTGSVLIYGNKKISPTFLDDLDAVLVLG